MTRTTTDERVGAAPGRNGWLALTPRLRPSPREMDVLRLLVQGQTNKEIAATLFNAEQTIKFHVVNLMRKLSARNRTELANAAYRRGLCDCPCGCEPDIEVYVNGQIYRPGGLRS